MLCSRACRLLGSLLSYFGAVGGSTHPLGPNRPVLLRPTKLAFQHAFFRSSRHPSTEIALSVFCCVVVLLRCGFVVLSVVLRGVVLLCVFIWRQLLVVGVCLFVW